MVVAEDCVGVVESDMEVLSANSGNAVVLELLGEKERLVLDCAVKEYLMFAGYKIAAMTFQEEVLKKAQGLLPYSWMQQSKMCCIIVTGQPVCLGL